VIPSDRLQSILSQHPLAFDLLEALASYRRVEAGGVEHKPSSDLDVGASDILLALKLSEALESVARSAGELLTLRKLVIIEVLTEDEARLGHSMLSNLDRAYSKSIFDDIPVERADAQRPLFLHEYSRWADLRVQADLADAVRRNSLVLCLAAPGTESMPASMRNGADVITRFPDAGPQHLNLIFQAVLGQTSEAIKTLERTDRLTLSDVGAIVRPAQQIEDCVRKLRQCLQTTELPLALPKLDSAHGYGSAKAWGLSMAADYNQWRTGKLAWDGVPDRGVLLSGAPGTGKSTFPRLLAATLDAPLHVSSVARWSAQRYLSGTLSAASEIFRDAKAKPGVLFLDEMDGIGRRDQTSGEFKSYWDQIINHLLQLISEAMATPGLIIVAATNFPEQIDPALLRSGRLERHFHFDFPTMEERRMIIAQYANTSLPAKGLDEIAERTEGLTGADLQSLLRRANAAARRASERLSAQHVLQEREADIVTMTTPDIRRLRVYRAGQTLVKQALPSGSAFETLQSLRDKIAVLLAGRVAEELLLGSASNLGAKDLVAANRLAHDIEVRFGLGQSGLVTSAPHSAKSAQTSFVREHLELAEDVATRILVEKKHELEEGVRRAMFSLEATNVRAGTLH